jgi:hypothetical protein
MKEGKGELSGGVEDHSKYVQGKVVDNASRLLWRIYKGEQSPVKERGGEVN